MGCHGLTSESPQRLKGSTNVRIREWLPIRHKKTALILGIRAGGDTPWLDAELAAAYFTSSMLIQRFSLADSIAASNTRWVW